MIDNLASRLEPHDHVALVEPTGERTTYADLHERAGQLAGGLVDLGLRPGDRVALLLPMSLQLYQVLLALWWVGATAVLVDPSSPVAANLARARPCGLVAVPRAHLLRLKVPALAGLDLAVSTGFTPLPHRRLEQVTGVFPEIAPGRHPALLTFTTGTTGRPKGMARSHGLLLAQHEALSGHMDLGPGDVDMPTQPVFLLHSLACGATAVLADADLRRPAAVDPARVVAQMEREKVTTTSGSPAFFEPVARWLAENDHQLPRLRKIFVGGARVPARLVRLLGQVCPNARILVIYGSTEAEPIAFLDGRVHLDELTEAERLGTGTLVGRPIREITLRIDDDEVQVSGAHVNPGYFDDPEADRAHKIREHDGRVWHRTGDAGFLDASGRLWLVGRTGERCGGLWPLPVEAAAERLPFVKKAGLVEINGKAVVACEMVDPPEDWALQVSQATGAHPTQVDEVPVDPRHNAKIDRPALKARVGRAARSGSAA